MGGINGSLMVTSVLLIILMVMLIVMLVCSKCWKKEKDRKVVIYRDSDINVDCA